MYSNGANAANGSADGIQGGLVNITTPSYNIQGLDKYKAAIHVAANASDATLATQTLIDHLTIYNIQTSSSVGAITIENASETTISNCIIASPAQKHIDSYSFLCIFVSIRKRLILFNNMY